MRKLIITLEITDQETVESYAGVNPDYILTDIQGGSLAKMCAITEVKEFCPCLICGKPAIVTRNSDVPDYLCCTEHGNDWAPPVAE